jgi:hypothetical protein
MNAHPRARKQSDRKAQASAVTKARKSVEGHKPSTPDSATLPENGKGLRGEHGVGVDTRGQDQPADKKRAQETSHGAECGGGADEQPPSPGQPAGDE